MDRPAAGLLTPGDTVDVGIIRLETLVTLKTATGMDFGYDLAAWQALLDGMCPVKNKEEDS